MKIVESALARKVFRLYSKPCSTDPEKDAAAWYKGILKKYHWLKEVVPHGFT